MFQQINLLVFIALVIKPKYKRLDNYFNCLGYAYWYNDKKDAGWFRVLVVRKNNVGVFLQSYRKLGKQFTWETKRRLGYQGASHQSLLDKIIGLVQFSTGGHVLSNAKIHIWYEFRAWKTLKQFLRLSLSLSSILGLAFLAWANFFPLILSAFFCLLFYLVVILF